MRRGRRGNAAKKGVRSGAVQNRNKFIHGSAGRSNIANGSVASDEGLNRKQESLYWGGLVKIFFFQKKKQKTQKKVKVKFQIFQNILKANSKCP